MILLVAGCMTMDSFFFAGTPVDAYTLPTEVIPAESLEEVEFASEDGTPLFGVWAHQPAPGAPVYVYFHGNTGNIDGYMDRVDTYWSMGFETFIFDYRGFGKSEGSPTWDTLLADGRAGATYVSEATQLPMEELVFHGLSLGGAAAIHTAGTYTPKVLITEDLFASADKIIDDGSGMELPPGWFMDDEWDNVSAAPEVHAPYLVIHAEDDTFVRSDSGSELYAAANDPKALWLAPGFDHDTIPDRLPDEYRAWLSCWVAQECAP